MQRISFYRLIVSVLLFSLAAPFAGAQENKPTAVGTRNGIWIYLGNEIPRGFRYEILRKTGRANYTVIGTATYPEDEKEMKAIVSQYSPYFGDLEKFGDKEVTGLRNYAGKHKTSDSITMPDLPVMHLALGTAYFDTDVQPGTDYQYSVRKITGKDTRAWERESNTASFPPVTDIMRPVFSNKEESRSQILIRWYVPEQKMLNTFAVYRGVFGKGDFKKIDAIKGYNSSRDTVFLIAIDTNVTVPAFYQYYLLPLDIYGNSGPGSDTVGAGTLGHAYNPVPDYLKARGRDKDHQVEISWSFRDKKYLRGIEVFRSSSFDGRYDRIALLPAGDTTYTDVVPVANENYWYYLVIDGPVSKSLPTAKVSVMFRAPGEKPSPPDETGAESVSGGVKVYWSYHDPYVKGFYVYRYVYEKSDYIQVSSLIPAGGEIFSYIDSVGQGQGSGVLRYAVRAVNDLDQMSDLSSPASANPGVRSAVGVPLNPRINRSGNGIMLIWDDLRNSEKSLMGYKVYRKSTAEKNFVMMPNDTLRNDKNYFSDTTVVQGMSYQYAVTAIDYYGNESPMSNLISYSMPAEYIIPPVISGAVGTTGGIMISWGQVNDESVVSVRVYRIQPGGKATALATLSKDENQYLDNTARKGELYIYEISLLTGDNRESVRSRGVSIRY